MLIALGLFSSPNKARSPPADFAGGGATGRMPVVRANSATFQTTGSGAIGSATEPLRLRVEVRLRPKECWPGIEIEKMVLLTVLP